ncbi:MAG: hypothetical protein JO298_09830 [Verrucomicrobia bacterium]|nr:hypothetical protein [Verrucomicrobiota bacterium]
MAEAEGGMLVNGTDGSGFSIQAGSGLRELLAPGSSEAVLEYFPDLIGYASKSLQTMPVFQEIVTLLSVKASPLACL